MILPFEQCVVNDKTITTAKDFDYCSFIGYLSPTGFPINYSRPFGYGGHNSNPITDIFMEFMCLQINDPKKYDKFYSKRKYKKWEQEATLDLERYLRPHIDRIREDTIEYGLSEDPYLLLKYDIYKFLYNCSSNRYFNVGFNGNNFIMSEDEFFEKVFQLIDEKRKKLYPRLLDETSDDEYWFLVPQYYQFSTQYEWYRKTRILEILKDVMTSYLGYHYVARVPRTIYTSNRMVYETFYNYLLNDFTIYRLPKMIYNPNTKQYEKNDVNEFLVSDRELRLRDEIEAIKKRIPREERSRFYR